MTPRNKDITQEPDEALVANFADTTLEQFAQLLRSGKALSQLHSALKRLSQPPSGGWDDAAVERVREHLERLATLPADGLKFGDYEQWVHGRAKAALAALNAAAPRESLSVEPPPVTSDGATWFREALSLSRGPYSFEEIAERPIASRYRVRDARDDAVGYAPDVQTATKMVALLNSGKSP